MKKSKARIELSNEGMKIIDGNGSVVLDATGKEVKFYGGDSVITSDGIKADEIKGSFKESEVPLNQDSKDTENNCTNLKPLIESSVRSLRIPARIIQVLKFFEDNHISIEEQKDIVRMLNSYYD
ncbi:hypothetical protein MUA82_05525 [Staphylococcus simulans]|uniref:hypothetical protein n=1 Tax=Staphylococcus simulans TaxID=1286 RepID=UPI0021D15918|nr:hypothetical protein [Staphylococcus simulans]UXR53536.1 hypothetical protein MUA82_05525 [Staphylococcus simulans]